SSSSTATSGGSMIVLGSIGTPYSTIVDGSFMAASPGTLPFVIICSSKPFGIDHSTRSIFKKGPFVMKPNDAIPLRRIDHLRFCVGNARQSAYFYRNAFGFNVIAYAGLETRQKHEAGYVLRQGHITFVLTSPLSEHHPESQRLVK